MSKENSLAQLATQGWVSLAQFAPIADVSYPTMLKLKNKGYVRAVKVGGVFRVYADEARRYLKEGNYEGGE